MMKDIKNLIKKFFEELYTDFYDKKFVDSDEINFNINSSRTGNYLENVCFITGFGYKLQLKIAYLLLTRKD